MKYKELIFGLLFITFIFLKQSDFSFASILIIFCSIVIPILIAIDIKKNPFWKSQIWLSILSVLYKSHSYIAITFIVLKYSGIEFIVVSSLILSFIYFVVSLAKNNNFQALNAYVYFEIVILFYIFF